MNSFFGPDFFTANRSKLRALVTDGRTIVITGNGHMQRAADEPQKFIQDSNFWYLTGLNGADLTLVMTANDSYLIVPSMSFEREAFDGAHDVAAYAARSGITSIMGVSDGWRRLRLELDAKPAVATFAPVASFIKRHGLYTLPYRRRLVAKLKRIQPNLNIQDIRVELANLRCIKQPEELQALQQAIDITGKTLLDIATPKALANVTHEYQLEASLSYGFRTRGAEDHAFAPIVGAGAHSTTLHYLENSGAIQPDDMIVLDVGASVEHYAADITRTVSQRPLKGRRADVFQAVLTVQDYALSLIKPGVLHAEYEKQVEVFMGDQLQKLGLIKDKKREHIRHYFPHSTSHFLGLDTHDVGDYRASWQPNMVITCEPGIYIPEEGIGVRIEDDVLITETGATVLSSACPRELSHVQ
jgi:Xaa-Pro aminopeptidase